MWFRRRELQLKEREHKFKEEELFIKQREFRRSRWSSPLVIAILGAALAGVASGGVAFLNGRQASTLEQDKAEAARMLEMIKTSDTEKAANNLKFLLDAGLITNNESRIRDYLKHRKEGQGPVLPSAYGDDSLRQYLLKDDNTLDTERRAKILAAMKKLGIEGISVTTFMYANEFKEQRHAVIKELGLRP